MKPTERGSIGKVINWILVIFVVTSLGAAVLYLLSEINHGRYRLNIRHDTLVVERGSYLPVGFEPFEPQAQALKAAYAPVHLTDQRAVSVTEVFDDRADLDRALFAILAGWARDLLESDTLEDFDRAMEYVLRAELLPGLSEEQRVEMRSLKAETAFHNGRHILQEIDERLNQSLEALVLSLDLGTTKRVEAKRMIGEIHRRLAAGRATEREEAPQWPGSLPPTPGKPSGQDLPLEQRPTAPSGDEEARQENFHQEDPQDEDHDTENRSPVTDGPRWRL